MGKKSNNLRLLAEYTDRIKKGDTAAVYEFVRRDSSATWQSVWRRKHWDLISGPARSCSGKKAPKAFPDREFTVEKVWESGRRRHCHSELDDEGHTYGRKLLRRTGIREKGGDQRHGDRAIRGRQDRGALGRTHCMHGIGLLAGVETPTELSAEK